MLLNYFFVNEEKFEKATRKFLPSRFNISLEKPLGFCPNWEKFVIPFSRRGANMPHFAFYLFSHLLNDIQKQFMGQRHKHALTPNAHETKWALFRHQQISQNARRNVDVQVLADNLFLDDGAQICNAGFQVC